MTGHRSPHRERRRNSFDAVAATYADARPAYLSAVFDELARLVPPPARVLEIGPGPGVATLPLAERGYAVVGVELGANLAQVARTRLAAYPRVRIVQADFEAWEADDEAPFDLVLAASSWHWLDPATAYGRVHALLRPGGCLALLSNHGRPGRRGSPPRAFWDATGELYRRHAPALATRRGPHPVPDRRSEVRRSGLFAGVTRRTWWWRRDFDGPAYRALLTTYSDHATLAPAQRTALLDAIGQLIDREFGGRAPLQWMTELVTARRRDGG